MSTHTKYLLGGTFIIEALIGYALHDPWSAIISSVAAILLLGSILRRLLD